MGLFEPSAGDFWEMKEKEEKEKARKGAEERERAAAQAHRADAVRRTVANYGRAGALSECDGFEP